MLDLKVEVCGSKEPRSARFCEARAEEGGEEDSDSNGGRRSMGGS